MLKSIITSLYNKLSKLCINVKYEKKLIQLNSQRGPLYFEACSPVESYRIANYGDEKEFLDLFLSRLNSDDVVFDIGASVGLFTVHASSVLESGEVFAFEPDPETLESLKKNASLNSDLSNISYVSWAVSDNQSETVLYTNGPSGFAPTLRNQFGRESTPQGKLQVKTNSLDNAISLGELPLPTVVKVDIEGAEILFLKGSLKLLHGDLGEKPRLIFLEVHPDFLPSFNSSSKEIVDLMINSGYSVFWKNERDNQIHYGFQVN